MATSAPMAEEDWVRADVTLSENEWMASFSDGPFTASEIDRAGAAIGLLPHRPQEAPPALAVESEKVEEIDADAQMREVQSRDVWTRQLNPYGSVTELALIMARRPAVQQAIMEEIRQDQALRSAIARATGVVVHPLPALAAPGFDKTASDGGGEDVGDEGGPFEALMQRLTEAARSAGAAIGAYVQRVMQTLATLSRLLRGKRVGNGGAETVVFDDEDSIAVDRAQVVMDMSIALASLLVLVAVLGRAGARVFA